MDKKKPTKNRGANKTAGQKEKRKVNVNSTRMDSARSNNRSMNKELTNKPTATKSTVKKSPVNWDRLASDINAPSGRSIDKGNPEMMGAINKYSSQKKQMDINPTGGANRDMRVGNLSDSLRIQYENNASTFTNRTLDKYRRNK